MAAKVGDEVVFQNRPCTVVKVEQKGGQQWDTLLFENPQVIMVPDAQVSNPPPPPPPTPGTPATPATPPRK